VNQRCSHGGSRVQHGHRSYGDDRMPAAAGNRPVAVGSPRPDGGDEPTKRLHRRDRLRGARHARQASSRLHVAGCAAGTGGSLMITSALATAARRRAGRVRAGQDSGFMLIYVLAVTAIITILVGSTVITTNSSVVPAV